MSHVYLGDALLLDGNFFLMLITLETVEVSSISADDGE